MTGMGTLVGTDQGFRKLAPFVFTLLAKNVSKHVWPLRLYHTDIHFLYITKLFLPNFIIKSVNNTYQLKLLGLIPQIAKLDQTTQLAYV